MTNTFKPHHEKKLQQFGMVDGLILEGKEEEFCVGCAYVKNHRKQFPWNE